MKTAAFLISALNQTAAPSTIAVNSMLTELALGKTVAEAKLLSNADIEKAFEGGIELQTGCPLGGHQGPADGD